MRRGTFVFISLLAGWLGLSPAGPPEPEPGVGGRLPRLILWAWERPSDLRTLERGIGVAFLAQTLVVRDDGEVATAPRRNPLKVAAHTPLVAVTRIETTGVAPSATLAPQMADAIAGTVALPRVAGLQIDFDARASEQRFYRELLRQVRQAVGGGIPISITALASWCAGDRWLEGLPIDEAVPMLFRMGPLNSPYAPLARTATAAAPECREALGLSLDEPLRARPEGRRVYVFNAAAWTAAAVAEAREVLE